MDRTDERQLSPTAAARLDRLFRLYNTRLLGFARTQTRDADAAQDVAAETWLLAGQRLHNLRAADEDALSWLCTIARFAAVDYYRSYEQPKDWTDDISAETLPAADSAEDVALPETPLPSPVATAFDALPEQDRTVVHLRLEGLSYKAIGQTYGRTEGSSYARYQRVMRTLRDLPALAGERSA